MKKLIAALTGALALVTAVATAPAQASYTREVTDVRGDFVKGKAYASAPASLKDNADILRVTYQRPNQTAFYVTVQLRSVDGRGDRNYQRVVVNGVLGHVGVHLSAIRTAEGDFTTMTWTGQRPRDAVCPSTVRSSFDVRHDVVRIAAPISCFPGGDFLKKVRTTAFAGDSSRSGDAFSVSTVAQDGTSRIPFRMR